MKNTLKKHVKEIFLTIGFLPLALFSLLNIAGVTFIVYGLKASEGFIDIETSISQLITMNVYLIIFTIILLFGTSISIRKD